jgi:hypothetical protein
MLDDSMTLTEYRLRPFELLEMQEKSRFLQVPRRVYLDMYWESLVEVYTRDKNEPQGIDNVKKLVRMEREVKVQQELQRDFVAEFMSNPVNEASEEPRSAAALMLLPWKNTPEAACEGSTRRDGGSCCRGPSKRRRRGSSAKSKRTAMEIGWSAWLSSRVIS